MTAEHLETSAHFRANLGVLDETCAAVFTNWATANCSRFFLREESGAMVLYATRPNARSSQQHKNTLKALASNKRIKLKTEASFLQLLHPEEYEAIAPDTLVSVDQKDASQEGVYPTSCKMEILTQLPDGFDERAREMLEALVAAEVR